MDPKKAHTCRMSRSAASRSSSRVKQWQCTIGITSYNAGIPVVDTDGDNSDDDGTSMPRNASRNVIAESGRFMTKCAMRLRGGSFEGIGLRGCCRDCARRCDCESDGPVYPGKGSAATRAAAYRIKSRPSSHDARTRSETYTVHVVCGSGSMM